jgi:signal transduction histidine kinase
VQLYDPFGTLLATSTTRYAEPAAVLAATVVMAARDQPQAWSGVLAGVRVQVALAPFAFGVVAVVGETAFIGETLARLGRAQLLLGVLLLALAAAVGWLLAREMLSPIRELASAAQRLGPEGLEPANPGSEALRPLPQPPSDDEIARLSRVLNDLVARLGRALAEQRSLLAETSHELRTPLTSLQGFLERALRRGDPGVAAELRDALRIAGGMSRLVSELLQLARGGPAREAQQFLIDPLTELLQPVAEEFPGVRLVASAGGARPANGQVVLGDPDRLRQLLRNLVSNAVRVAGAEQVSLRLEASAQGATLVVHDAGPGIPPEEYERVFDKGWSGSGGSGLGLAIAQQIARAHGSRLQLTSEPGDTRFALTLSWAPVESDDPVG